VLFRSEIKAQATEYFTTYIVRDELTINTEDYPELKGMSEEEAKDYIKWNATDMYKEGEDGYSLWDELLDQDIVKNKISGDETEVLVD
jgi:hypothetical protein